MTSENKAIQLGLCCLNIELRECKPTVFSSRSVILKTLIEKGVDNLKNKISASVAIDTFYEKDYGFDMDDFNDGFETQLPYNHTTYGIKSYINTRKNNALSQLIINDISPVITQVNNNHPSENQAIYIQANILDDQNITQVEICYTLQGGNIFCEQTN